MKTLINIMSAFLLGAITMALFYCRHLGIESGPLFVGMGTVALSVGGLAAIHALIWLDPSFN